MKSARIMFSDTTTILTYNLSNCNISSAMICDQNPMFHTAFYVKDHIPFDLPTTTLLTMQNKEDAEKMFKEAVEKLDPNAKITKMFIFNVSGMDAFVENNE